MKELEKWFKQLPNHFKGLIAGSIIIELLFYAVFAGLSATALSQLQKLQGKEKAIISPRQLPYLKEVMPSKPKAKKSSPAKENALVTKVIDGDTIEVEGGRKVRYIGIDCPEKNKPYAEEAFAENRKLVEGRVVMLVKDVSEKDVYGRLLRYVYVGDVFVNAKLVENGLAEATPYPPDVVHEDEFAKLEKEAINAGKGIWTRPAQPVQPQGQSPQNQQGQVTVCINEPGFDYHMPGCQKLGSNSKTVPLDEAKAKGYTPCTQCNPPK